MAQDGWVKSTDPRSGKTFYANHLTRKTQWEPPPGWIDDVDTIDVKAPENPSTKPSPATSNRKTLPDNWEEMHDPGSGRSFYVDHVSKVTTWEHPGATASVPTPTIPKKTYQIPMQSSSSSGRDTHQPMYQPHGMTSPGASYGRSRSNSIGSVSTLASYSSMAQVSNSNSNSNANALPPLDFKVIMINDELRDVCPSCDATFSLSKRRHHCRLCGDVFCDACSSHRQLLPLDGPEFEKPVRLCDSCSTDVSKSNYFSMRRYLTVLQVFDTSTAYVETDSSSKTKNTPTARNVAAALSSLAADLDALLLDPTNFEDKLTIQPDILVPAICRHLVLKSTSDRAIRALGSLLALGNMVGNDGFALSVYVNGKSVMDSILALLEWSGTDKRTLAVQEQASRSLFYLSDPTIIQSLFQRDMQGSLPKAHPEFQSMKRSNTDSSLGSGEDKAEQESDEDTHVNVVDSLDIHRTLRNMLDHTTTSASISLQRWAAACIRNLVAEDQRRACLASNDAASMGGGELSYTSFLSQLVETGGIMILCSLIGAEDADTRAHATAALSATISATRAIDASLAMLQEVTTGRAPSNSHKSDAAIVSAIVSGGGCGSSLSQLLLSADNTVARMGCSFAKSLVDPLLLDPRGSAAQSRPPPLPQGLAGYTAGAVDQDDLTAYRDAALALCGGCLPALMSLLQDEMGNRMTRPLELRKCTMETLAAITLAVGRMNGEEAPVKSAIQNLEGVGAAQVAFAVFSSTSSLITSHDSPQAQLREAAGLVLAGMTSCSPDTLAILKTNHALSGLLGAAGDDGMMQPSSLRGEWAPKSLGMLEAAATILMSSWKSSADRDSNGGIDHINGGRHATSYRLQSSSNGSTSLDLLLEVMDAGAVPTLREIIASKVEWHNNDKANGSMRLKIASCQLLAAMFGIAWTDATGFGATRLFDAIDSDSKQVNSTQSHGRSNGRKQQTRQHDLISGTVALLQIMASHTQQTLVSGGSESTTAPLMDFIESALLAVGSMCGASFPSVGHHAVNSPEFQLIVDMGGDEVDDEFADQKQAASEYACGLLTHTKANLFPSMVVGSFGEGSVLPALRLALFIVKNGRPAIQPRLAQCGILVPVSDLMKTSLKNEDYSSFVASLSIVRVCGPHVAAGSGEAGGLQCLKETIRCITQVLDVTEDRIRDGWNLRPLKIECLHTLEGLSENQSLWSSIAKLALPSLSNFLLTHSDWDTNDSQLCSGLCAALRTINRIVPLSSHAITAARAGISTPLAHLICKGKGDQTDNTFDYGKPSAEEQNLIDDNVQFHALQALHTLASHAEVRRGTHSVSLVKSGALGATCFALGSNSVAFDDATEHEIQLAQTTTKLGLEIVLSILSDIDSPISQTSSWSDDDRIAVIDQVVDQVDFLKALFSTLCTPEYAVSNRSFNNVYGPSFEFYDGVCGRFSSPEKAAFAVLILMSVLCSSIDSNMSEHFWQTFLAREKWGSTKDSKLDVITACSAFLHALCDEKSTSIPRTMLSEQYIRDALLPLVQQHLLDSIHLCLETKSSDHDGEIGMISLMHELQLMQTCLSLCSSPVLLDSTYVIIDHISNTYPDECLPVLLESKASLQALFEMMNPKVDEEFSATTVGDVRELFTRISGVLAERELLGRAVHEHGLRTKAIASLSAACLAHDDTEELVTDEVTNETKPDVSFWCLRSLADIFSVDVSIDREQQQLYTKTGMCMSSVEAKTVSVSLGKKISDMVLARFLKHSSCDEEDEYDSPDLSSIELSILMDSPEIHLLCALATNKSALPDLCASGGLEALSLVATQGELSAIMALQEVCKDDSDMVLQVNGHKAAMDVLLASPEKIQTKSSKNDVREVKSACFGLLVLISRGAKNGTKSIAQADKCPLCVDYASTVVCSLVEAPLAKSHTKVDEEVENETSRDKDDTDVWLPAPPPLTSELPTKAEIEENEDNDDKAISHKKASPPLTTEPTIQTRSENDGFQLELAALSFLSEIVSVEMYRAQLLESESLFTTTATICKDLKVSPLRSPAADLFATLAPFAPRKSSKDCFCAEAFVSIFGSMLDTAATECKGSQKRPRMSKIRSEGKSMSHPDLCTVLATAVSGLACIFDDGTPETKGDLITSMSTLLLELVKSVNQKKSYFPVKGQGLLACNITSFFLSHLGDTQLTGKLLSHDLLIASIRLILLRNNAPQRGMEDILDNEAFMWKAAETHVLQYLSVLLRNDMLEEESGSSLASLLEKAEAKLTGTTKLMPPPLGKLSIESESSPLESEFIQVLRIIVGDATNSAGSVAASRLLRWINFTL